MIACLNRHCPARLLFASLFVVCVLVIYASADDSKSQDSSIDLPASLWLPHANSRGTDSQDTADRKDLDRTYYWIPAFDRIRSRLDREFTSLSNANRDAIKNEQAVAEQEIAAVVSKTARPWSSSDAIDIYRRIVRLAYLGNRESHFVQTIATTLLPEKTDKSFLTLQNKVPLAHPTMRWPMGTYNKVASPHFEVTTQGTPEIAQRIAILAEQTHALWQQAFLPAWCEPSVLESAILERKPLPIPAIRQTDHRMQVVLFKNRDQYVRGLREIQPNIGISTGFYHPGSATVFCYWDESVSANVLKHEITHQLFSEASRWEPIAVESLQKNFWIIEGVALYMESMLIDPSIGCDRVTLGGWDSPRLQPARYRRLHDEFWIPWDQFTRATAKTFQQGDAVGQHYSQAAGLAHFAMDHSSASHSALINFIGNVYKDEINSQSDFFSEDDDKLRSQYDHFLLSAGDFSATFPPRPSRKDVVLSRTDITSKSMLSWPENTAVKLDWLDLSFTKVDDSLWTESKSGRWDTRRLNVEGTQVSDKSLPAIAAINRLEELDLSMCKISDSGLESLRGHRLLRKLWLTGTGVTDNLIDLLASLPRLEEIELTGTKFTDAGRQELARRLPRLRRN
jgi:hypothetical protein